MRKDLWLLLIMALVTGVNGSFASDIHSEPADMTAKSADTVAIPISKADLGTFPFFRTLDNFTATDSTEQDMNRTYFYDGKKYIVVDGRISAQNLNIKNSDQKIVGEFACIDAFDKVIAHLGGVKIYTGPLPEPMLKTVSGSDIVELASKHQLAPSAHYGVVEYVIRTEEKEVWVQLQPYSLGSKFYTLLVVEKTSSLLPLNTNRSNKLLKDLETTKKTVMHPVFGVDSTNLLSDSKADMLQILEVFQRHPEWKLTFESYCAAFGNADYSVALTTKRAEAMKHDLTEMGVKPSAILVKGMGEQKPVKPNDTERGRAANNRIEISLQ